MSRIKILPESVKNKIAAGEVVEGPFSVVKELLENSIDAGSTEIDVEIFESGLKKIVIKDNGSGIYRDDLPFSIQSHATSKINEITDIESISSYGFRGEALSSISSISRLAILTRSREEEIGAKLINHCEEIEMTDYAGAAGTTIIIENLFFNVPARKKFLKGKGTESRKIKEVFLKTAIANPQISFSLSVDGKRSLTLTAVEKRGKRIEQIYGKKVLDKLYFDRLKDLKVEIAGYLSKPDFLKSSRSMQMLFVNNRFVEYKYLGFLLSRAYEAVAPKGSHPVAFLFITIDPELLDINIHPAKREVKFFDQRYIDNLIIHLPEKILGKQTHSIDTDLVKIKEDQDQAAVFQFESGTPAYMDVKERPIPDHNNNPENRPEKKLGIEPGYSFPALMKDTAKLYKEIEEGDDIRALGVIFDTYILVEEDNAIHFIDFHAAHERFIYDSITNNGLNIETQALIFPQVIELAVEDYEIVLERKDSFSHAAFDIDIFSDNSIIVRGIPNIVKGLNVEGFFMDVIESLKINGDGAGDIKDVIAEKMACHSAKRAGDKLTEGDANTIAREAFNGGHELRCPHGRPYIYKLDKNDLEKVFKRL
ncbi:MAG: DNA mismatch repair endonuclease MutL [bacterium]|nr:DNA mismatch repair endonuclease MutL [bacterium]